MQVIQLLQAVLVTSLASSVTGARILAILPLAGKSHHIFFQAILKPLALRGHEVVVYSSFPQQQPVPNYTDVFVDTKFSDDFMTYEMLLESFKKSPVAGMKGLWEEVNPLTEDALRHKNIQKLINSDEKFDLVITEAFFAQEAFLGFGHKFKAPVIAFQSFGTFSIIDRVMGNSLKLSYIPDTVLPFTDHMNFYERLVNSYSILSTLFSFYYEHIPNQQAMMERHLGLKGAPALADMLQNISLVLMNTHPTIHYPQPLSPDIVPLGGIHVYEQKQELPQHIHNFMDDAKSGVVYFSLGSFVPDHLMPKEYFQHFINVFKKLPQRVIWKTRAENIELPSNVMAAKWLPQQSILAHPNCVLFITHGGLLSLLEAVYAGIPTVGIPFYGDQSMNVRYYEERAIGVKLNFLNISEETISRAVGTVLKNPQYRNNAKKLSRIFRDLPMSPADTAVYWVEYVLRHRGAAHLKPAAAHLTWYQLALLDVLAAIVAVILVALLTLYLTCRKAYSLIRPSRKQDQSNKKRD